MAAPSPLLRGLPSHAASPGTGCGSAPPPLLRKGGSRRPVRRARAPPGRIASPAQAGRTRSAATLGPTRGPGSPRDERPQVRSGASEPNPLLRTSRIKSGEPSRIQVPPPGQEQSFGVDPPGDGTLTGIRDFHNLNIVVGGGLSKFKYLQMKSWVGNVTEEVGSTNGLVDQMQLDVPMKKEVARWYWLIMDIVDGEFNLREEIWRECLLEPQLKDLWQVSTTPSV
ncbi:hypothetical protein NDU88_001948 [Pleurodeles waltl]|uniref:Uncharacterized protein n=1 Tax=Pleurodeles waltl TaxID=8319 RepID=A0AAV7T0Y1_PLEWA|nr:hypothetical protein NDU88_001948 [Pleurodeles waltl]